MATYGSPMTRIVILLLLTGALSAAPATANARSVTLPDPRGDMAWIHTGPDDDDDATPPHVLFPAPEQSHRDIISTRIRHTTSRVQVRITFAELRREDTYNEYDVTVVTNEGFFREVAVYAGPGRWAGEAYTSAYPRDIRCRLYRSLDYDSNVLVIGFARRCVSYPRWVRVAAGTSGGGDEENDYFYDDSQRRGLDRLRPDTWRLSPRVARGSHQLT